jgi:hypothetical protein
VTFPSGRRGLVVRFATTAPLGRLVASLRERPWRSPATVAARVLIHLQRAGVPAPRLLAFGQRLTSPASARSFVLYEPVPKAVPFALPPSHRGGRCSLLRECGVFLRRLHDAGCRLGTGPAFAVANGTVSIDSPFAVRLAKRLSDAGRRADIRRLFGRQLSGLSRADRARVVRAYLGESTDRRAWKHLLARIA